MCLRSPLRWTVIPSAPDCSQITAAVMMLGSMVLRASRIVATWSMFTLSLAGIRVFHHKGTRGFHHKGTKRTKVRERTYGLYNQLSPIFVSFVLLWLIRPDLVC